MEADTGWRASRGESQSGGHWGREAWLRRETGGVQQQMAPEEISPTECGAFHQEETHTGTAGAQEILGWQEGGTGERQTQHGLWVGGLLNSSINFLDDAGSKVSQGGDGLGGEGA